MENSYRFYTNYDCKYYPCHKTNSKDFNCMFCYCPLYFLDCKGNYKMKNGVKDCTNCLIPHTYEGYDYINKILKQKFQEIRKNNKC